MRAPQKVWDGARVVIGDSDDDNESQHRSEGAEREVLIMPKLDFGLRKKANALAGKGDTQWSVFPEIYYDLDPGFWRPTLAHLFWHSYIVMTIILCQSLCSQTGIARQHTHLFDLVSSILLCCFWSINNVVLRSISIKVWFVATIRYLFLQSSLAWTHRLDGFPLSSEVAKSHVLTSDCYYHSVRQSFESNRYSCLAYLWEWSVV